MKGVFIVIVIAIFFVSVSIVNVFKKRKDVESEIAKTKKENISLIEKKNELANLLDYFQDKSFIEKEARRRLNLQKPGEKEVIVVDNKSGDNKADSSQANISGIVDLAGGRSSKQDDHQDNPAYNPLKWFKLIFQ